MAPLSVIVPAPPTLLALVKLTAPDKLLLPEDATDAPGPRNAATLTPLGDGDYLLHGGWRPFVSTYSDSYVLHIDRE